MRTGHVLGLRREEHLGAGRLQRRVLARDEGRDRQGVRHVHARPRLQGGRHREGGSEHPSLRLRALPESARRWTRPTPTVSGTPASVKQRQDIQVNKAIVFFQGWLMSPKFGYSAYVWTTNTSQGLARPGGGGRLLRVHVQPARHGGRGHLGLPGARSTEGQWPNWLGTDQRLIADEFFRPSYTTGLFARGEITKGAALQRDVGQQSQPARHRRGATRRTTWNRVGRAGLDAHHRRVRRDKRLRRFRGPRHSGHTPRHPLHAQRRRSAGAAGHGGARQRRRSACRMATSCLRRGSSGRASTSPTSSTRWSRSMRASSTAGSRSKASSTGGG